MTMTRMQHPVNTGSNPNQHIKSLPWAPQAPSRSSSTASCSSAITPSDEIMRGAESTNLRPPHILNIVWKPKIRDPKIQEPKILDPESAAGHSWRLLTLTGSRSSMMILAAGKARRMRQAAGGMNM